MRINYALGILLTLITSNVVAATYYTRVANADLGIASHWSTVGCGGLASAFAPGVTDNIIICNGHTVEVSANKTLLAVVVDGGGELTWTAGATLTISVALPTALTVNSGAEVNIPATAGAELSCSGITNNGTIDNKGRLSMGLASTFVIGSGGTYIHEPLVNDANDVTMFTNSTETFSSAAPFSNLVINKWHDNLTPLAQDINGDLGNVTMDVPGTWYQDGAFAPAIIKGTLTISDGTIYMDDRFLLGSTALTLQDVVISDDGTIMLHSGANRNMDLVTGDFTDNATGSGSTSMIFSYLYGDFSWTVNGDLTVGRDLTIYQQNETVPFYLNLPSASSVNVSVTGDFNITGGLFDGAREALLATTDIDITVDGTTTISGTPGWVRFIDSGAGDLTYTTNNMTITGGTDNNLMAENQLGLTAGVPPTGSVTVNVTNDFTLSGTGPTVDMTFLNNTLNTSTSSVTVGNDLNITQGDLVIANSLGVANLTVGGDFNLNGANADFWGQIQDVCNATASVSVGVPGGGKIQIDDGNYNQQYGTGDATLTMIGTLDINSGNFYMTNPILAGNNAGVVSAAMTTFDFDGGACFFSNSLVTDGRTNTITTTGDFDMNFTNNADEVYLLGRATTNNGLLDFNVNGNFISSGSATAGANNLFFSSGSFGAEDVDILGNMTISGGNCFFEGDDLNLLGTAANGHTITMDIGGNLTVSNGELLMAGQDGDATINVTGNVDISGGTTSLKWDTEPSTLTITGNYSQTNGTFNLHKGTLATPDVNAMTVNGTFSHTGGTFDFDKSASSTAINTLTLRGANVTLGGTGSITHASAGTGAVFGEIHYGRAGTTVYNRTSNTHYIQQVKQYVDAGTILDGSATTQDHQIASNATEANIGTEAFVINGTYRADLFISAYGPSLANYYSGIEVGNGGVLQITNANGFYDGVNAGGTLRAQVFSSDATFRMDYDLDANSTIEYYGNDPFQEVTGMFPNAGAVSNISAATAAQYKYGILKINHQGTLGTDYCLLYLNNVYVRTQLDLTRGEMALHNSSGVGRTMVVESGATTAIISTANGYLESEEINGGNNRAKIQWNIGATTGAHVVPFGVYSGGVNKIPVTFNNSGNVGNVNFSTRNAASNDNTPYAAASNVAAVGNMTGVGDALTTAVDRWWDITTSVASPLAASVDLSLSYLGAENTLSNVGDRTTEFGIQHWNGTVWNNGQGGGSGTVVASGTNGVTAGVGTISGTGFTEFSPYVVVKASIPLPVELLSFNAVVKGTEIQLDWETAMEINNDYFTVERSRNGIDFETVKTVKSLAFGGNSNDVLAYKSQDENPLKGVSYYRLKQVDFNGEIKYSEIKAVKVDADIREYSLYPNPANNLITLSFDELPSGTIVSIFDIGGRLLFQKNVLTNLEKIDISNYPAGLYFIDVLSDNNMSRNQLIKN